MTGASKRGGAAAATAAAVGLVVVSGGLMAGQAEINGALSAALADPLGAALISFGTGFGLLCAKAAGSPKTRAGIGLAWAAARRRDIPGWYLGAGAMGASVVLAQAAAVPLTGVAVFIVAVVAGQMASGLVVDSFGIGGGGRRPVSAVRVVAAALIAAATVLTASGDLAGQRAGAVVALAASAAAGALISVQVACNGSVGRIAGTPWAAAFFNFAAGTSVLGLAWAVSKLVRPGMAALPGHWWLYLGGAIGVTVIALHSWLVHRIGVLLLGLALVTGQLGGALALRWLLPGRAPASALVVAGVAVALAGAVIGALPARRRR